MRKLTIACALFAIACVLLIRTSNSAHAQRLYFVQNGGFNQFRAWVSNVDGTQATPILVGWNSPAVTGFNDIAVDHDGGFIYLADTSDNVVRASLDGSAPVTIGAFRADIFGGAIAVDPVNRMLYYPSPEACGCLSISNLDGSQRRNVDVPEPIDIAVDGENGYLFYSRSGIYRANLDGEERALIHPPGANGIALDTIADKIYWTDGSVLPQGGGDPNPPIKGHIYRANYDGSNVEVLVSSDDFQELYTSEIAVDPVRGMVYWYNPIHFWLQSATTDGVLMSSNLLGTQIPLVEGLAIDYIIPEPPTALIALAAAALFAAAATSRRRPLHRPQRA
jgi:hypothetical protein